MRDRSRVLRLFIFLSFILLASCNFPGRVTESPPQTLYTQAARTVEAQLTSTVEPVASSPGSSLPGTPVSSSPTRSLPSATTSISPSATGVPTLAITPTENLKLLFSDDFSSEVGWYTEQGEKYGFEFIADGYRIYVNIPQAEIWSIRDNTYSDVILEVEAARMAGAKNGYYGLICRQVDDKNYYALVIGSDGFFGIGKVEDGELTFIQEGQDTAGVIYPDAATFNKIRADCIGDKLRLYGNGKLLVQAQDGSYQEGDTGLIIGTRTQPDLEVLFDNFATYQQLP